MSTHTPAVDPEDELAERVRRLAAARAVAEIDLARVLPGYLEGKDPLLAFEEVPLALPEAKALLSKTPPVAAPREGFSGADPYEIALRYAAGQLSRERLVDELSRWDYAPDRRPPHPLDDGVILGDWKEYLVPALDHGLIDDATYEAIRAARSGASGDGGTAPERQTDMSTKEDHA